LPVPRISLNEFRKYSASEKQPSARTFTPSHHAHVAQIGKMAVRLGKAEFPGQLFEIFE
jgi:hypothetical protein